MDRDNNDNDEDVPPLLSSLALTLEPSLLLPSPFRDGDGDGGDEDDDDDPHPSFPGTGTIVGDGFAVNVRPSTYECL